MKKRKLDLKVVLISLLLGLCILTYFNVLDLIYALVLIFSKKYVPDLIISPPQVLRVTTLSLGVYTNINLQTIWQIITRLFLALDFEIPIILFLLAFNYLNAYFQGKYQKVQTGLISYLYIYFVVLVLDLLLVIINLIPFHTLDYYAGWFGLLCLASATTKLAITLWLSIIITSQLRSKSS